MTDLISDATSEKLKERENKRPNGPAESNHEIDCIQLEYRMTDGTKWISWILKWIINIVNVLINVDILIQFHTIERKDIRWSVLQEERCKLAANHICG